VTAVNPPAGQPASPLQLPGFDYQRVDVEDITINCAVAGTGPPLLLLHGYPQNHLTWRHVAPGLTGDHTVVMADLRGYGDSGKPAPDAAGLEYSKRSMARDQVQLMSQLGFRQFQLVSHDRGARVAHRLVLDHPGTVTGLAILDIVPTRHVLRNVTLAVATTNYFWFFLAAGNGIPEHMIAADPGYWVRAQTSQLIGEGATIEPTVMEDYIRCFSDPAAIAACCADFRAAAGPDLAHDDESFAAGQKIECPVLVLWGERGLAGPGLDLVGIWRPYAQDVRGNPVPAGHFLPEEAPALVTAALRDFLG
jgi:haloacetate dehalogenase